MQYRDWGERSPRWRGIRSETVDVCGTRVHYLRADADHGVPSDAPVHLLVHPMAAAGSLWLDLIRPLAAYGPVIAPDLPGTVLGDTEAPSIDAARLAPSARFLRAFAGALDLRRLVVHGWSMGGQVAIRLAALAPKLVDRVVLACPPVPVPVTRLQRLGWQTIGRGAVTFGPALARALVGLWGRRAIDTKLSYLAESTTRSLRPLGGDPTRIPVDTKALLIDQVGNLRARPTRMGHAATAFAAVVRDILVDPTAALEAIDRVSAPVLLLWGAEDRIVVRPMITEVLARRPDWDLRVFSAAGHLLPLELPDEYVAAVATWLEARPVGSAP